MKFIVFEGNCNRIVKYVFFCYCMTHTTCYYFVSKRDLVSQQTLNEDGSEVYGSAPLQTVSQDQLKSALWQWKYWFGKIQPVTVGEMDKGIESLNFTGYIKIEDTCGKKLSLG